MIAMRENLKKEVAERPTGIPENLSEVSQDPLFALNTSGKITDLNEALVLATGISRDKLTGAEFTNFVTEPSKARKVLEQVLNKGSIRNFPLTIKHKNGGLTEVLLNASANHNNEGNAIGVFVNTRDISELRSQQIKIQALNKELQYRINELDSFSYSVSHDLRAPLRAVDGFIAMFLGKYEEIVDEEGQRLLNNVRNNVTHMGRLMDELLMLSGIGKKGIHPGPINMRELVNAVLEEFVERKGDTEVSVGNLGTIRGDIPLIRQVLVNLVSNAIKFTSKQENPRIEIGCEEHNSEITFYVKDNGIGFDMEYAGKLFGVFQRLCDPKEYSGTGMGLAVVKHIITLHGGKVWAEGKENEGSIFYFSLKK